MQSQWVSWLARGYTAYVQPVVQGQLSMQDPPSGMMTGPWTSYVDCVD